MIFKKSKNLKKFRKFKVSYKGSFSYLELSDFGLFNQFQVKHYIVLKYFAKNRREGPKGGGLQPRITHPSTDAARLW